MKIRRQDDCSKVEELLSAYIDKELDGEKSQFVRQHLSSCKACKEEYRFLKSIIKDAGKLEPIEVSDTFRAGLHDKLAAANEEAAKSHVTGLTGLHGRLAAAASAVRERAAVAKEQLRELPGQMNRWSMYASAAAGVFIITVAVVAMQYTALPKIEDGEVKVETPTVDYGNLLQLPKHSAQPDEPQPDAPQGGEATAAASPSPGQPGAVPSGEPQPQATQGSDDPGQPVATAEPAPAAEPKQNEPTQQPEEPQEKGGGGIEPFGISTAGTDGLPSGQFSNHSRAALPTGETVKHSAVVTFTGAGAAQAKQLLGGHSMEDGYYVVTSGSFDSVTGQLSAMEGFVSMNDNSVDMTGEYNEYKQQATSLDTRIGETTDAAKIRTLESQRQTAESKMREIISKASKGYIKLVIQ